MSRNTKIWPGNVMILANLFGFLCNVLDKHTRFNAVFETQ